MWTAASATPTRRIKINAVGTWNLACACASIDCAIAYVSTDYVFDGEKGAPYTEFDTPNPMSAYGASKLAGETRGEGAVPRSTTSCARRGCSRRTARTSRSRY